MALKAGFHSRSGPILPNLVGVPRGALLPPTLFSLVIATLQLGLKKIPGSHYALYTNDITFWVASRAIGEQKATLRTGLNGIATLLRKVVLSASPDAIKYVDIFDNPRRKVDELR